MKQNQAGKSSENPYNKECSRSKNGRTQIIYFGEENTVKGQQIIQHKQGTVQSHVYAVFFVIKFFIRHLGNQFFYLCNGIINFRNIGAAGLCHIRSAAAALTAENAGCRAYKINSVVFCG